jgi:hypothetical protein
VKRLLLLAALTLGCSDSTTSNCGKEACCPSEAANGVPCGMVRDICGVDPVGSCTCTINLVWSCFGTEDLSLSFPDLKPSSD